MMTEKVGKNPYVDSDPRNEAIRTVFAETAILLTHTDEARKALAKERVYAMLYPVQPPLPEAPGDVEAMCCPTCDMPLGRDGGCHYPYCSGPAEPTSKAKEEGAVLFDRERVRQWLFNLKDGAVDAAWVLDALERYAHPATRPETEEPES